MSNESRQDLVGGSRSGPAARSRRTRRDVGTQTDRSRVEGRPSGNPPARPARGGGTGEISRGRPAAAEAQRSSGRDEARAPRSAQVAGPSRTPASRGSSSDHNSGTVSGRGSARRGQSPRGGGGRPESPSRGAGRGQGPHTGDGRPESPSRGYAGRGESPRGGGGRPESPSRGYAGRGESPRGGGGRPESPSRGYAGRGESPRAADRLRSGPAKYGDIRRDNGANRTRDEREAGGRPGAAGTRRRDPEERRLARDAEPALPDGLDTTLLDRPVRAELRSLSKANAEIVGAHLVAAGLAVDVDPQRALAHARAARGRASRLGCVREAVGIAAYHAAEWNEALTELRTARRITGDGRNLAVIADCERALGRPAQALKALSDPAVGRLNPEARAELFIVVAGARRDLGQDDAALSVLSRGGLDQDHPRAGSVRLWYAYADTLQALGRRDEAAGWFAASAALDREGETDAADRAAALL